MDLSLDVKDPRRTFEDEALPYLDSVYSVALALARDRSLAEDLTQETMFRAFRYWHRYQPGTNVCAWLLTILRNTYFTGYRRQQRRLDTTEPEAADDVSHYPAPHEDPEGRFFEQLVDETVLQAIDALPDELRETLVLSDMEGFAYQEISEITGVPIGTVKSRLFRARQILQRRLYQYAVEAGHIKAKGT